MVPTRDFASLETEAGEEYFAGVVSLQEMSLMEKRFGVSRNVLAIAVAMLALQEYCHRDEIHIDSLNHNRTDVYLQHTVGLVFKILPLAINLLHFPGLEDLLREVKRQLVEGFAHSICDYSSLVNVPFQDALVVNYVANMGDASALGGLNFQELEPGNYSQATESHVEIYLMEDEEQVNISIEYQKQAYGEGSMKRFLDIYVEKFRQLVKG